MSSHNVVQEKFLCSECNISYKSHLYLRKHAKKFHPHKWQEIAPLRSHTTGINRTFNCDQCHKSYSHKANLTYHLKKVHGVSTTPASCSSAHFGYQNGYQNQNLYGNYQPNFTYSQPVQDVGTSSACSLNVPNGPNVNEKPPRKCALCDYVAVMKSDFYRHYTYDHHIPIESETLEFPTYSEFLSWIDNFEKETQTRFVKQRASDPSVTNYACHRAGFYMADNKGRKGNNDNCNRNGFCPARFKLRSLNQKWVIEIIKTHVGHEQNLGYFHMAFSERESIDSKIKAGVPFNKILDEIRDSVSDTPGKTNKKKSDGNSSADLTMSRSDNDDDDNNDDNQHDCTDNWSDEIPSTNTIVVKRKDKILQWFKNILGVIETEIELDTLEELMNHINATLQTLKQNL